MNERDRIELLMKSYDLSPSQFADRTGIQRASVSHILSGRNKPSLEVMLKIYEAFPGLSMEWLMAGIGTGPVVDAPIIKEEKVQPEGGLFATFDETIASEPVYPPVANEPTRENPVKKSRVQPERARREESVVQQPERRRPSQARAVAQAVVPQRQIKEIRIFYTDGTYETLVPEK